MKFLRLNAKECGSNETEAIRCRAKLFIVVCHMFKIYPEQSGAD